jgi:hypothetical protein
MLGLTRRIAEGQPKNRRKVAAVPHAGFRVGNELHGQRARVWQATRMLTDHNTQKQQTRTEVDRL